MVLVWQCDYCTYQETAYQPYSSPPSRWIEYESLDYCSQECLDDYLMIDAEDDYIDYDDLNIEDNDEYF